MNYALIGPGERLRTARARGLHGHTYTFTCSGCERTEHSLFDFVPEGWDLQPGTGEQSPCLRCPDCIEKTKQATIARHHAQPFMLFLEKQVSGEFQIAIAPENVLMRWLPLGFYLTPTQARILASQLKTYAALAENPGSVPADHGGDA